VKTRSRARRALLVAIAVAVAVATGAASGCTPTSDGATASARTTRVSQHPPPTETLTPLIRRALPDVRHKTFTAARVRFPPGASAVPHRHGGAFVYAYVLEGSIRSKLQGDPAHVYRAGGSWVEAPGAHHLVTENISSTQPAELLVVFVSTTGARLKIDDPPHPASRADRSSQGGPADDRSGASARAAAPEGP
jgi:quercetin dioxygenase-like cupin family protein